MSKRKRRRREEVIRENVSDNVPFGINPAQLMGLLGNNIDFNQIGNMLSSMKTDGLDLNNFNINSQNTNNHNNSGFNLGPLQGFMNSLGLAMNTPSITNTNNSIEFADGNNISNTENDKNNGDEFKEEDKNNFQEEFEEEEFLEEDENIQMLIAIKSIVDTKKAYFLDRIIEEYNKGNFK